MGARQGQVENLCAGMAIGAKYEDSHHQLPGPLSFGAGAAATCRNLSGLRTT